MKQSRHSRFARQISIVTLSLIVGGCSSTGNTLGARPDVAAEANPETEQQQWSVEEAPDVDMGMVRVPVQVVLAKETDDYTVYPITSYEAEANVVSPPEANELGAVSERAISERKTAFNPYVLTAHKQNYVLPVSYSTGINETIYQQNDVPLREGLQPAEVKFQISLKTRLNENDLFYANDALSLGITLEAWWQLYSSDLSSPFRETNYQPELFYFVPLLWGPFGGNTALLFGLEHQSNGQVQGLSRSWNRLYSTLIYENGNFIASVRPWYRLPEKSKKTPDDAEGDDNPDIADFMGYGELNLGWRNNVYELSLSARGNTSTGNGAYHVGITFPLFAKFRGFVQYFSGYGDSLIDYNHYQQRLGVGVALTNLY